jgi:hypothetical protein
MRRFTGACIHDERGHLEYFRWNTSLWSLKTLWYLFAFDVRKYFLYLFLLFLAPMLSKSFGFK